MPQRPGSPWVFLLLALAGAARAEGPRLRGRYRGEGLGELELTAREGQVVARHVAGGGCGFRPEAEVLTGSSEGNVLVASLHLCQRGVSCQDRELPVLAFSSPQDGALTAHVELEAGCSSPEVQGTRVRLVPVGGVPLGGVAEEDSDLRGPFAGELAFEKRVAQARAQGRTPARRGQ